MTICVHFHSFVTFSAYISSHGKENWIVWRFFCENLQFCSLLLIKVREVPAAANTNKSQRKLGAGSVFAKMLVFKAKKKTFSFKSELKLLLLPNWAKLRGWIRQKMQKAEIDLESRFKPSSVYFSFSFFFCIMISRYQYLEKCIIDAWKALDLISVELPSQAGLCSSTVSFGNSKFDSQPLGSHSI